MMKKIVLIILCIVLAATAFTPAVTATHSKLICDAIVGPCGQGTVTVLRLSDTFKAKGTIPAVPFNQQTQSPPISICCHGVEGLQASCQGSSDTLLKLSAQRDAQAALPGIGSNFPNSICLSAPGGVSCVAGSAPDSRYSCVVAVTDALNGDLIACTRATASDTKIFCKATAEQPLPKFWQEAFGIKYPSFGRGHMRVNGTYDTYDIDLGVGKNVVIVQDRNFDNYGLVSDPVVVQQPSIVTASVNVSCQSGTGIIDVEFWDNANQRIGNLGDHKNETAGNARLIVNAITSQDARYVTVLLHTLNPAARPSVDCGFDDVQLVFNDPAHALPTAFRPYAGYDDDVLADPATFIPFLTAVQGGYACCAQDSCWDGVQCQANMANDATAQPIHDYRCIDGNWIFAPERVDLEGKKGFCASDTQCLLSVDGNPDFNGNVSKFYLSSDTEDWPQCLDDKDFVLDNYCDAGIWTSRTKKVAQELLALVERRGNINDYTLYCDDYEHALVELNDPTINAIEGPPETATNPVTGAVTPSPFRSCFDDLGNTHAGSAGCVNHMCVLKFVDGSQRKNVVGTSLNIPPGQQPSLLPILGFSVNACNGRGAAGIEQCAAITGTSTLWFNDVEDFIVFSRDGVNLLPSAISTFFKAIANLLSDIIHFFTGATVLIDEDIAFVRSTTQFDRLYLHAAGGKRIIAIQETRADGTFILAQYHGFTENLCSYMQRISSTGLGAGERVTCSNANGVFTVFSDDPDVVELWQEFTSRLRVQP